MVNNAPLVHVSGYARGMTQATVCATESDEFVVGITKDPDKREREHALRSPWHPHAKSRTVEWHGSRGAALDAERAAIHEEAPLFNRLGARDEPREYVPTLF